MKMDTVLLESYSLVIEMLEKSPRYREDLAGLVMHDPNGLEPSRNLADVASQLVSTGHAIFEDGIFFPADRPTN